MNTSAETIADIVREMRELAHGFADSEVCASARKVRQWAERIKDALSRDTVPLSDGRSAIVEVAEHRAHLARLEEEYSRCRNAAAMREALLKARNTLVLYSRDMKPRYQAEVGFMVDTCDAALAAPARNCDRYATLGDALRTWSEARARFGNGQSFDEWLFAEAEGGAE